MTTTFQRGRAAAARRAHDSKVAGSNPAPATIFQAVPHGHVNRPLTRVDIFLHCDGMSRHYFATDGTTRQPMS